MNFESVKYILDPKTNQNHSLLAIVDGESIGVPLDSANRHYAAIMEQVEAGELTIQDADD